ncbi:MAG: SGNH/GDSL hydrolase family protein, partial [Rhodospirillales bacterium]
SPPGDFADAVEMPGARPTEDLLFLGGIEVLAPPQAGAVVAFGDSLTDGNISTVDGFHRWPDRLARRLAAHAGGRPMAVLNHGIGGNRILHDQRGESGLRRFDCDVIAQPGATHAIVILGINDIRNRYGRAEEIVTAEAMIAGLDQLARRGRAAGITMIGGTLLTFEHETFNPGFYTPEGEAKRQAVNAWIRSSGAFDAVVDFEAALRDPGHPTRMLPQWDCGDHLHPSDAGYERMGDCIDLALFD